MEAIKVAAERAREENAEFRRVLNLPWNYWLSRRGKYVSTTPINQNGETARGDETARQKKGGDGDE